MTRPPESRAGSVEEILAIADALERAAVSRYAKLADGMRQIGRIDLAGIFQSLAAEEQLHVQGVQKLQHARPPAPRPADLRRWILPETFGAEEAGPAALLTPYKALSIAVRAEERAFAFWTYVASTAEGEAVRNEAEEMARQELLHAAKLRHARRRAYHDEYPHGRHLPERQSYHDVAAVREELARLQAGVGVPLAEILRRLERVPDAESARLLRQSILELTGAEPTAERIKYADLDHRIRWAAAAGSAGLLFEAVGLLERLAEHGLDMLNAASDSPAAADIQAWVDRTIHVVARLNGRLYALEPGLAEIAGDAGAGNPSIVR